MFRRSLLTVAYLIGICCPSLAGQAPTQNLPPGSLLEMPFSRGNLVFTTRSAGTDKAVFCVQEGLAGKPRVLVDSQQDPALERVPINSFCVSDDGKYFAYFVPQIPRRFEEIHLGEVATGKPLPEVIQWTYFSDFGWQPGGFIYGRYPKVSTSDSEPQAGDHLDEKIYSHRLGTVVDSDRVVYEDPAHPEQKYLFLQDFRHRWLLVHVLEKFSLKARTSEWFSRWHDGKLTLTAIQPNFDPGRFFLIDEAGGKFLIYTLYKAPKGRVILVDPKRPTEENWQTVIPEGEEITDAEPVAGKLVVGYKLPNGGTRIEIRSMKGKLEQTLPVPDGDMADIQWCAPSEKQFFFSLQHGKEPKRYFSYRMSSGEIVPVR